MEFNDAAVEMRDDVGKPWRYEEDGCTVTRTCVWSAPGCHPVGCGLKLYVKDGEVVKVEGDENHPVTKGRLCVRCLTLKDFVYHPDRIIYPMKRDRANRGKDEAWERCTWDEAFDIIKENYDASRSNTASSPSSCFTGTGREGGTCATYEPTACSARPTTAITRAGLRVLQPASGRHHLHPGHHVPRDRLCRRAAGRARTTGLPASPRSS